ncbi:MAG: thioesterase family protein [Silvanigrellaceae bacterium]|nr:thioesterase family protein [Silvanigrellaceae bacterium]
MDLNLEWLFIENFKLRWSDIDVYGHLTSPRYIDISIESRLIYLNQEISYFNNLQVITKNLNLDFKKSIYYHDPLILKLKLLSISNASFELLTAFYVNDTLHAEVITKLVVFDKEKNRLIKVPEMIKNKLHSKNSNL